MDRKILDDVHRYWFGDLASPTAIVPPEKTQIWFRPTVEIDDHIRDTFGAHLDAARDMTWSLAELSREQQVGLVILLDQFPRQIFRGSGRSFAYDAKAKAIANALLDMGLERFFPVERTFIILPLEHSENIADQDRCVWLFAGEAIAAPAPNIAGARKDLDFATKHRDIIRKFGRFPHRNDWLGRPSTPEEIEFLKGGRGY
jgi:uncharacterized protein (DUF924 family)